VIFFFRGCRLERGTGHRHEKKHDRFIPDWNESVMLFIFIHGNPKRKAAAFWPGSDRTKGSGRSDQN